ncbi:MAG: HAMP domain-containing histidine kinase, partial [Pseudomonadales bacterium]|nr:HAMP domain-containing histidine kinase [Pseudomonadales bacterium]
RLEGRAKLIELIDSEEQANTGRDTRYYLLLGPDDRREAGQLLDWPSGIEPDRHVRNVWFEDDVLPHAGPDIDGYWPTIATRLDDGSRLLISQSVKQTEDLQEFILAIMLVIFIATLTSAIVMGWFLNRSLLARIDKINETAQAVRQGDLGKRVALGPTDDEFDELGRHLNRMLDRIEQLLTGLRQVTDNVAHDLRKPLTRIKGRLEVTLLEARSTDDYRQVIHESIDDADGLLKTFNALLEIAQAESGSFRGEWTRCDITDLLENLADLYQPEADAQSRNFQASIAPGLSMQGNRHLLAQAIANLLDNAFKYTPTGKAIRLEAFMEGNELIIKVEDSGQGIPAADRARVLDRFVRLEMERSTPGNGLGLALVRAVADLHHGHLELGDNNPGLAVTMRFPAPPVDIATG